MALQGEYVPSPAEWVRNQVETYENSGGTAGTTMRGLPVVIVTTVGAKSGKLRKIPLMRVEHDGRYAAIASLGGAPRHPVWYYNLLEHPCIELQDGPVRSDMTAREVTGTEKQQWWDRAVAAFPGYADYQARTERESRCSCSSQPASAELGSFIDGGSDRWRSSGSRSGSSSC